MSIKELKNKPHLNGGILIAIVCAVLVAGFVFVYLRNQWLLRTEENAPASDATSATIIEDIPPQPHNIAPVSGPPNPSGPNSAPGPFVDATSTDTTLENALGIPPIKKNTDPTLSVTLENGVVLKNGSMFDGFRISGLEQPIDLSHLDFKFAGPVRATGYLTQGSEVAFDDTIIHLDKPIFTQLKKEGFSSCSIYSGIDEKYEFNKPFSFFISAGLIDLRAGSINSPDIYRCQVYINLTDGTEMKSFSEGNTTIQIEEVGDPVFSFYSLPFLPRITISNTWGKRVFELNSDEEKGLAWGRGKPSNIRVSPTGRFISFEIYYGDGFALPVIYDMKTGQNILEQFLESERIMFVPEVAWLPDERGFVFTSTFSSYGGDGVAGIFYWHDTKPQVLTVLTRVPPNSALDVHKTYINLHIQDSTVSVEEVDTNNVTKKRIFPLPL